MSCLACDITQAFLAQHPGEGHIVDDCTELHVELDGFQVKTSHTCGRRPSPSPWVTYPREFQVDDRCDI